MSKKEVEKKKIVFEDFIKLTERFYVKPCEAAPDRFDLYELKKSESERHPEGKMDDMAFGLSLDKAAEKACYMEAGRVASNLKEMIEELRKVNEEIRKNVIEFVS